MSQSAINFPEPGSVWVSTVSFRTLAGVTYDVGDEFVLVRPTMRSPFGSTSGLCNWIVRCRYFDETDSDASVWSNIWGMIERRHLIQKDIPVSEAKVCKFHIEHFLDKEEHMILMDGRIMSAVGSHHYRNIVESTKAIVNGYTPDKSLPDNPKPCDLIFHCGESLSAIILRGSLDRKNQQCCEIRFRNQKEYGDWVSSLEEQVFFQVYA